MNLNCQRGLLAVLAAVLTGTSCSSDQPSGAFAGKLPNSQGLYTFDWVLNTNVFNANFEKETHLNEKIQREWQELLGPPNQLTYVTGDSGRIGLVVQTALCDYMAKRGVKVEEPSVIFYNDRLGEILYRGTRKDCIAAKRALERLNDGPLGKKNFPLRQ